MFVNPYFWTCITGCTFGFALNVFTRIRIARLPRLTIAFFVITVGVVCAAIGAFVSGPGAVVDIGLAYFGGGSLIVAGSGFRFPRSVGIPLLLILSVCIGFVAIGVQSWTPIERDLAFLTFSAQTQTQSETETQSENGLRVEYRQDDEIIVREYAGDSFAIQVDILEARKYWFFAGTYAKIQFHDVSETDRSLRIGAFLPGWRTYSVLSDTLRPRELYEYDLSISHDDRISIDIAVPGE
jgi:hypothetical protein